VECKFIKPKDDYRLTIDRPWAMQCWAPFTILGVEINKMANASRLESGPPQKTRTSLDIPQPEKDVLDADLTPNENRDAGVYLGILNLYNTMPQFIGTFISWAVFTILEPGKSPELAVHAHPDEHHSTDGPNAISVCLFIGAMAALMAAYETRKLKTDY
jgi:solute carrier family 45 protein 1/2/4